MNALRESVLAGVRVAADYLPPSAREPLPPVTPDIVRQPTTGVGLVELFCQRAAAVGLRPAVVTESALPRHIGELLRKAASAQAAPCGVLVEPDLPWRELILAAVPDSVNVLTPPVSDEQLFAVGAGISGVAAAVAETGSIVCVSGPSRWRSLSLVPPVHIAVVREEQILPDLLDLLATAPPENLPAQLVVITGPSKTADIEGILITGVHGPGEVHVVVVTAEGEIDRSPGT
ncbi:MAG TPA: lactate utilization protein C [Phycisphaerae bacterium]|nr:lactate utilization protein C [Phycisphaerae bacterium]HNU44547.1 lactate utilization protein C [Phycisphaerae bacterium]